MSGARAAAPADADAAKGRVAATVVPRYRAGQAPHYAGSEAVAPSDDAGLVPAPADAAAAAIPRQPAPPVVVQDPRLARLAAVDATAGPRRRVREVVAPEIVKPGTAPAPAPTPDDVSDDELARRREAVRERARAAAAAAAEAEAAAGPADGDNGESSSSYETDSDDSDSDSDAGGLAGGGRLLKPVFVPRGARDTAAAAGKAAAAAADDDDTADPAAEARAAETRAMVARVIAADDAAEAAAAAGPQGGDGADVDTDDDAADADAEFAAWKQREFARLRRDAAADKTADDAAAAERAALAALTDEERRARAAAIKAERDAAKGAKPKLGFMQKYYHRGAFFQDGADAPAGVATGGDYGVSAAVAARDAAAATGEDAWVDKAALPKIMQVKNFGRRGGSKYTHLADQDTTRASGSGVDPLRPARELEAKRAAKLAGTGDLDKPKGYRT